ncbi:MAG: hypothetical protein KJ077_49280 [Anaerolineae bacterium]|nr:hypothetical protein [Anaerolineae bacterium]
MTWPQFKRGLGLSLKILLTLFLSFLFLEFLLLVFNDVVFRKSLYVYDPDMGFRARSYARWGDNITNEFGFNDRDYPHQKKPGTYRILILGDSFNWAGGLEGNYASLLERKFEVEFGDPRVEIINAGYHATHTGEQLVALKKFGLQYNPDLVVLGFFVGNDFFDAVPWRRRINVGGSQVDIDTRKETEITFLGQLVVPLQSRLYLFLRDQWATYKYLQIQRQAQPQQNAPAAANRPASAVDQAEGMNSQAPSRVSFSYTEDNISEYYLELEMLRIQIANSVLATSVAADEFKVREEFAISNLLAMHNLLKEKSIPFMLVAYPDNFQIEESLRQVVFNHYQLNPAQFQLDRPQRLLWEFCQENQIEFYDMLPTFQAGQQQGQRLYLVNDSHWNDAGNQLAADYLFETLMPKVQEFFARQSAQ